MTFNAYDVGQVIAHLKFKRKNVDGDVASPYMLDKVLSPEPHVGEGHASQVPAHCAEV